MPSKIKTVYFDFGNVISLPQNPVLRAKLVRTVLARAGEDAPSASRVDQSEAAFWESYFRHRDIYDKDEVGAEEYWRLIFADLGLSPGHADRIEKLIEIDDRSWSFINHDTLGWARKLKTAGKSLGILSNMPERYYRENLESSEWIKIFDHVVISGLISLVKPEPEIFLHAIKISGSAPEGILYFDDMPRNVEAARKLGIKAYLFTGMENVPGEFVTRPFVTHPLQS